MTTVYKYSLQVVDIQSLMLPVGAEILSVAEQNNQIVLYAQVSTWECSMNSVAVYIIGTGNMMDFVPSWAEFLGTVKMYNGSLMWHVFVDRKVA